ncbi:MAG: C/D box methylation guide ribonucleoprotein complex aNOP56 subunit [Thaumarchaeota archaeon]|nr:C/D box methylation guide ribonucleoprotein complex aNOP56 subunit [Nitrososphaerota archaeon]
MITEGGILFLNEKGDIISSYKIKDFNEYESALKGELSKEILNHLINESDEIVVQNEALKNRLIELNSKLNVIIDQNMIENLGLNKVDLMIKAGLVKDQQEALELIRNYTIYVSQQKLKEHAARLDLHAIQLVQAIDEIDKTINLFYMRLREWYGLHFPELYNVIDDPETYLKIVHAFPDRNEITTEKLEEINIPRKKAEIIESLAVASKGASFDEETSKLIDQLAELTIGLFKLRKEAARQLEKIMEQVAPNVTSLVGATIGARLLSKAGSLERLAKLPASTIQVLGAEKALFRALKRHAKPPKHGIIFQHKLIHDAPKKLRGKLARALAAKLAIAARIDYYGGKKNYELTKSFNKKVEEIKKKFFEEQKKGRK